jgi:membrane protein DedA with SNARE-associated domain/rhodanese-related sulfurtransferase
MIDMNHAIPFLVRHGYAILFGVVLLEQLGLPIPAVPILLAMGALAGFGKSSLVLTLLIAVAGSLVSDIIWYELGRHRGRVVLRVICRISLEPDYCIRRTEAAFSSSGTGMLLFAKFMPGLNIAAPPLVAMLGMRRAKFIAWDSGGALLWASAFSMAGFLLRSEIEHAAEFAERLGLASLVLAGAAFVLFVLWKYIGRRRFLRGLRMSRITPEELWTKLQAGEDIVVADLRHPLDFDVDHVKIPGALRLLPEEIDGRHREIPRDRDAVLYCNCPNEATSAAVAMRLRRLGITRVRPLAGGFEAWRARNFPIEAAERFPRVQ